MDNQEASKKKPLYKNWWVIIGGTVLLLIVVGSVSDSQERVIQTSQQAPQEVAESTNNIPAVDEAVKIETTTQVENKTVANEPITSSPIKDVPVTIQVNGRDEIIAILKTNAEKEWGTNYQMVKYEYENQAQAYEWVSQQTAYPNIMSSAKKEWGTNYQMVKYEYENQVEAYQSL